MPKKVKGVASASMGRVLRYGIDRLCFWYLCDNGECRRARGCRGDVLRCGERFSGWYETFQAEQRSLGSVAALEARLKTPEELGAHREWEKLVDKARAELPARSEERAGEGKQKARRQRRPGFGLWD